MITVVRVGREAVEDEGVDGRRGSRILFLERTLILSHAQEVYRHLDPYQMAEGTILLPVLSSTTTSSLKLKPVTPVKDTSKRRVTVLSFWAVALLGVPYWWKTTTVERLELPRAEIQGWRDRAVSSWNGDGLRSFLMMI